MINRKWIKRGSIVFFCLLVFAFLGFLLLRDNIHSVVPGEVYRSAQLSPSRLRHLVQTKGIRSIINLRGANPNYHWYQDEVRISRMMKLMHYDIRLDSTLKPELKQLQRLVYLLQNAPKPILLHCQGGADRTGFAAAMFLLLKGRSVADARRQFSWFYHVSSPKSIGKLVLPYYAAWLKSKNLKTSRAHFLQWVRDERICFQKTCDFLR